MDKKQEFFDLLFEEPFGSKEFILLRNMINETDYKLKTLINNAL